MKIILVRHGESTANTEGTLSSMPSDKVYLTSCGRKQTEIAAKRINGKVDTVYISPLKRTIETSNILIKNWEYEPKIVTDYRLSEINYGKYSGKPNNRELDSVRRAQAAGDYLIRFGESGENKLEILMRLYDFLIDTIESNSSSTRTVVVSHGSITGWLERIILSLGNGKISNRHFNNAEISIYNLRKCDGKKLQRHRLVDRYCSQTKNYSFLSAHRSEYIKIANLYNDVESDLHTFEQLLISAFKSKIN